MDAAEEVALSQASDEKRIRVDGCDALKEIGPREQPSEHREMAFKKNRHFAFQRVNTSYGCLLYSTTTASSQGSNSISFSSTHFSPSYNAFVAATATAVLNSRFRSNRSNFEISPLVPFLFSRA